MPPIQMSISAPELAQLVNAYSIAHRPNKLMVPNASQLAKLRDVTLTGTLLPKQLTTIEDYGVTRSWRTPATGPNYQTEKNDGDIHFCLGSAPNTFHMPCELQHGADWLDTFNGAINSEITVSGFFRCLFEHPGFSKGADAHIFEIHPVRAVDFGSGTQAFDVDVPDVHGWVEKFDLNRDDAAIQVSYDAPNDTLTFTHIPMLGVNYVRVTGTVSQIDTTNNSPEPSTLIFTSPDITTGGGDPRPLRVLCMKGTSADRQLEALKEGDQIQLVALRNIDLDQAMQNQFVISLLGIQITQA
jgi:hypothetical protein